MDKNSYGGKVEFFSSGSTLLDAALGGGWGSKRIFNLVGDKSTGKTLLAIEGMINFYNRFSGARIRYGEAEAALDETFASELGMPDTIERPAEQLRTVEAFYTDLDEFQKKGGPSFYILDSLDALSDSAELARDLDEASYGAEKAKKMSQLFRRLTQDLAANNCTLCVISQVRDNIGVAFGDNYSRSGGRALDFYCSQVVYLAHMGQRKRTVRGQERAIGVDIKAKVKKNKVGFPFREAEFGIDFGYGIDDETSMLDWLKLISAYTKEEHKAQTKRLDTSRDTADYPAMATIHQELKDRCLIEWKMIEEALAPRIKKYSFPQPALAPRA